MKRSAVEIREVLFNRGIARGTSVTWPGFRQQRFATVGETSDYEIERGNVRVHASNGDFHLAASSLTPCNEIWDTFKADVDATYPPKVNQ